MCGRFVSKDDKARLGEIFSATRITPKFFAPSHNVAPTESVPIILECPAHERTVEVARFGQQMTVKGKSFPLLNIQSEKAANREDLRTRRCIIPAAGFYEWEKVDKEKRPYYFSAKQGLLAFAGVWMADDAGLAFSIFTTTANDLLRPIHARMPVILGHNAVSLWLAPHIDTQALLPLLEPYPATLMQAWPVSKSVNYVKNKGEECINSL